MCSLNHKVIVLSAVIVLFLGACTVEPPDRAVLTTPVTPHGQESPLQDTDVPLHEEAVRKNAQLTDALANRPRSEIRMDG